jgi:REP element-mobilizing transposase RayT
MADAEKERPCRKRIRLSLPAYEQRGTVFSVTICCNDHKPLLEDASITEKIHHTFANHLLGGMAKIIAYAIMPDHVHLLVQVGDKNLVDVLAQWKSYTTKIYHDCGGNGPLWQRSFYDHGIRREEDLVEAAAYIANNPLRANRSDRARFAWHQWLRA